MNAPNNDPLGREVAALRATLTEFRNNWATQDDRAIRYRDEMREELTKLQVAIGGMTRDAAAARQDAVEIAEKVDIVAIKVDKLEKLVGAVKGINWAIGRLWVIAVALISGIGWVIVYWWHSR